MLKSLSLMFLFSVASIARAEYFIATYGTHKFDPKQPARIMVAGEGQELKLLFQEVAKAKAEKFVELNPEEQIIFITAEEPEMGNEGALKRWGFKIVEKNKATLDGKELIERLVDYKKIMSLDIFSHSSAQYGIHFKSRSHRLNINTKGLEVLKKNFTQDAYAFLHGCNSGFNLAPFLSKVWGIPVAGSLTSSNFQRLHSDGHFYLEDEGSAPNKDWSRNNALSFNKEVPCKDGYCLRLKPDNTAYVGFWGAYREGGLPFYKWFCVNNSEEQCFRVMARNLLSQTSIVNLKPDSNESIYKKAVVDYLCPISGQKDLRRECEEALEQALVTKDYTYNPFTRPQVECNFKKCDVEVTCDKILITNVPKPGTCHLTNNAKAATTLVREYESYLKAYQLLK